LYTSWTLNILKGLKLIRDLTCV